MNVLTAYSRVSDLSLSGKLRLGGLLCAKALLDGIALIGLWLSALKPLDRRE
jgi:hypothetical protein